MENIRQAVERAKGRGQHQSGIGFETPRQSRHFADSADSNREGMPEVELDFAYLQSRRIVAHDGNDPRSRSFDMLRTQILRSMDLEGWRTLAVTSPSPGCGKTFTAVNLALSMGRQPERQVLLADLDLRKPHIADCLGLNCKDGTVGVIEGRIGLQTATVRARIGGSRLDVLPTVRASNSSDLVSSSAMRIFLEDINSASRSQIVILDLPPLLAGHDVISILPQVDCVLMVAAVGKTKVAEIQECNRYLADASIVRFVLNKAPESETNYGYYG